MLFSAHECEKPNLTFQTASFRDLLHCFSRITFTGLVKILRTEVSPIDCECPFDCRCFSLFTLTLGRCESGWRPSLRGHNPYLFQQSYIFFQNRAQNRNPREILRRPGPFVTSYWFIFYFISIFEVAERARRASRAGPREAELGFSAARGVARGCRFASFLARDKASEKNYKQI